MPDYQLYEIAVDAVDPRGIARWWADVLGATYGVNEEHGDLGRADPGSAVRLPHFSAVPEPKTVKNRIHWDVRTDDLTLLTDAGATVLREHPGSWTVMADPEGNEFCAFLPSRED